MLLQYGREIKIETAGIVIENLRMGFEFKNRDDELEQDSKVKIWNLQDSTYKQIFDNYQVFPSGYIKVFAGYTHATGLIEVFSGTIAWLRQVGKDGSIITEITVGDRVRDLDLSGKYLKHSWKKSVTVRYAINEIARTMDTVPEEIGLIPSDLRLAENYVVEGPPSVALRKILESVKSRIPGLYWFSDGKKLTLGKGADPRSDAGTLVKAPESGLVGVPEIEEDKRMKVTMLLDPRVNLKGRIRFWNSRYINPETEYTIDTVSHIGDNWTGKFITRAECIPPGYVALSRSGNRTPRSERGLEPGSRIGSDTGGQRPGGTVGN